MKTRLYYIDAPEMGRSREARGYLRSIIEPVVRLEVKDKDRCRTVGGGLEW